MVLDGNATANVNSSAVRSTLYSNNMMETRLPHNIATQNVKSTLVGPSRDFTGLSISNDFQTFGGHGYIPPDISITLQRAI